MRWIALGLVVLAGAAWYVAAGALRAPGPEPLLEEARDLLSKAGGVSTPEAQRESLATAQALLGEYLVAGGPRTSTAHLLLCIALGLEGDAPALDVHFAALDPAECEPLDLAAAAMILFGAGRGGQADALLEEALGRSVLPRQREQILRTAATVRYDLGREDDVLQHCRELAGLVPGDPRPWMVMALVQEDRGDWMPAVEAYREVVRRVEDDPSPYRQVLVDFLVRAGEVDEARREFDRLRAENSTLADESRMTEAGLLYLEGDFERALHLADRAAAADLAHADSPPERQQLAEAQLLRGRIFVARSEWEAAVAALADGAAADPLMHEIQYLLSTAWRRLGDVEKSERHLAVHRRLLHVKKHIFALERRAGSNPTDLEARRQLVKLYEEIGSPERAEVWRNALAAAQALAAEP